MMKIMLKIKIIKNIQQTNKKNRVHVNDYS